MIDMHDAEWCASPHAVALEPGEIHVWRSALDSANAWIDDLQALLDEEEIGRSHCYRFHRDRSRFVVRRGVLRTILAIYLNALPRDLRFTSVWCGKPRLVGPSSDWRDLDFSVSSSNGVALYAVGRGVRIGIDIETFTSEPALLEAAEQLLTRRELTLLHRVSRSKRSEAFLALWTRKEAYVKACGIGLARPPCEIEVPQEFSSEAATQGYLLQLSPAPSYVAALAVEGSCRRVRYLEWAPSLLHRDREVA